MSRTLNLADGLLKMGRTLQEMGRTHDAQQVLSRLAAFRELPAPTAEETQARLAEILLRQRKYKQARRHLTAALTLQPDSARYHYLLATAFDLDEKGDPETALAHYRKSLELDPDQPDCLGDYGLLAICMGEDEEGLRALRRAVDLDPDNADTVGKLLEGLCQLERPEEARLTLRTALFRNPRHDRFRKLWSDFRFQQVREEQEAARHLRPPLAERNERAVVLPFVWPAPGTKPVLQGRKVIRHDGASTPAPPHMPRPTPPSGRKHA
jgi:tetratricopeptide (TPR) repeat protein